MQPFSVRTQEASLAQCLSNGLQFHRSLVQIREEANIEFCFTAEKAQLVKDGLEFPDTYHRRSLLFNPSGGQTTLEMIIAQIESK